MGFFNEVGTKDHAIWTSEAMEASFKNALHRWVAAPVVAASCAKNPEIPVAPKTHVALLHQFVKNSPTWKRSYGSLGILKS